MRRLLTAPSPEEPRQGVLQEAEALEVVVVRDFAAEPLPDRLDRIQVRTVGRQEAQPQPGLRGRERGEGGAPMPGRPIEDDDHQHRGVRPQELLEESLEVGGSQPGRQATMELSGGRVECPEPMDLLMRPRPVAGPRLFAREAPLAAERGGQLHRHLVLEEDRQALGSLAGEAQEPSELPFFSRRRHAETVGSRCRGRRSRAPI